MVERDSYSPDAEFWELYDGSFKPLTIEDCEQNVLYFGSSRSISDLAICRGSDMNGGVLFEGWRNKSGDDHLFVETYKGPSSTGNVYRPYLAVGEIPAMASSDEILTYLLDASIEMMQEKCEWLERMPDRLKGSRFWQISLEQDRQNLESLLRVKEQGFSKVRLRAHDLIKQDGF